MCSDQMLINASAKVSRMKSGICMVYIMGLATVVVGLYVDNGMVEDNSPTASSTNETFCLEDNNMTSSVNTSSGPKAEPYIGAIIAAVSTLCLVYPDHCRDVAKEAVKRPTNAATDQESLGVAVLSFAFILVAAMWQKRSN